MVNFGGGHYPSEFRPDVYYWNLFKSHSLNLGRMVGGSKSRYLQDHPDNIVIFNANIITKKSGKIWYGDLSFPNDSKKIQDICNILNEKLYILRELDARFENEQAGFRYWKKNAVEIFEPL